MGQQAQAGDAASAVQSMIEPWTRACIERDWDALLAMCNDDIVFMPPGAEAVTGQAVRPWLDTFPGIQAMSWSVSELKQDGATAWLRGPVKQTLDVEGQIVQFDGKYADVMRRSADGRWRFSLIIWNANSM